MHLTYKWAKRIAISIVGGTVLLVGLCMVVLPGPALVVIPLGLAILSVEFAWAQRWLRKVRERAQQWMPYRKTPAAGSPESGTAADINAAAAAAGADTDSQRSTTSTARRNSS